jgi:uncharacterized protein YdiU (UPF0061 family)
MTISGETIDYGPCAFIETYDPAAVFSSIDHGGRYAFGNQPHIARWNLARLAEALLPLMANADDEASVQRAVAACSEVIDAFPAAFDTAWRQGQRRKLGLSLREEADDATLADAWLALLHAQAMDFTLAWLLLADAAEGRDEPLRALAADVASLDAWLSRWRARCERDGGTAAERAAQMRRVNPRIIARNHRVEEALAAASSDDELQPFRQLLGALQLPFDDDAALARYAEPAPREVTACYQTFCGT